MKKIIVMGMAFVILCACTACGVMNNTADNVTVEDAVDAALEYVEETYEEGCTSDVVLLNDENREVCQPLFDEDLDNCVAVVAVYDVNGEVIDCFAVKI